MAIAKPKGFSVGSIAAVCSHGVSWAGSLYVVRDVFAIVTEP